MDDLHRYLSSLGISQSRQELSSHHQRSPNPPPFPNATAITNPYGTVYLIHEVFPITEKIHSFGIPAEIQKWTGIQNPTQFLAIEDFLFVDIETTGTYGGAGVICFLVGIGQLMPNELHLSQYLILHPEDELAQLMELEKIFLSAKGIMTYNGKSFDLPLIQSRYQFHQIPLPTTDLLHIDLLHLARRIWKHHLPSRTLRTMEASLLGIQRKIDDIPGWMIPDIYRDFLLSQDASFLTPVLSHNRMDVFSLAHLYLHITNFFTRPPENLPQNAEIFFQLANFYQSIGETAQAIEAYLTCRPHLQEESKRLSILENLAFLYKKQKEYAQAEETWREAASLGSLKAHLELIKYYLHIKKDVNQARLWVEAALKLLETKNMDRFERAKWQSELQYRLERLNKTSFSRDAGKDQL